MIYTSIHQLFNGQLVRFWKLKVIYFISFNEIMPSMKLTTDAPDAPAGRLTNECHNVWVNCIMDLESIVIFDL